MINTGFIFSLIAAVVTLGGLCVAFGVLKAKIAESAKVNDDQKEALDACASRMELVAAIKRSDELLDLMRKRAEEDRVRGDGQYKELYGIINIHGERIASLETSQTQLFKTLDKLEATVTNGFRELRQEMKELRDSVNGRA